MIQIAIKAKIFISVTLLSTNNTIIQLFYFFNDEFMCIRYQFLDTRINW